jgi:PII-like signaling protein
VSEEALTLTTYFGERARVGGRLLADELLDTYARHEIRASILLRGVQGFGGKHQLRTDRLLTLSEDLPLVAMAIDTPERIEALLGDMKGIDHEGLLTLERTHLGAGELLRNEHRLDGDSQQAPQDTGTRQPDVSAIPLGKTVKLTVHLGRHDRIGGAPAFAAVCELLHECGVAGATVLLGVDGTRHGERRRARFFAQNKGVLPEPLLTTEPVRVCKRDGELLGEPHDLSATDEQGKQALQKLTIVTSEAARHENRSLYLELVRCLCTAGAAGATSLRGIWGFHGDHLPHGDRLLALRRHVPVVTVAIDTPERIASLFAIADELTQESGLLTSELIPAASALHSPPAL